MQASGGTSRMPSAGLSGGALYTQPDKEEGGVWERQKGSGWGKGYRSEKTERMDFVVFPYNHTGPPFNDNHKENPQLCKILLTL